MPPPDIVVAGIVDDEDTDHVQDGEYDADECDTQPSQGGTDTDGPVDTHNDAALKILSTKIEQQFDQCSHEIALAFGNTQDKIAERLDHYETLIRQLETQVNAYSQKVDCFVAEFESIRESLKPVLENMK